MLSGAKHLLFIPMVVKQILPPPINGGTQNDSPKTLLSNLLGTTWVTRSGAPRRDNRSTRKDRALWKTHRSRSRIAVRGSQCPECPAHPQTEHQYTPTDPTPSRNRPAQYLPDWHRDSPRNRDCHNSGVCKNSVAGYKKEIVFSLLQDIRSELEASGTIAAVGKHRIGKAGGSQERSCEVGVCRKDRKGKRLQLVTICGPGTEIMGVKSTARARRAFRALIRPNRGKHRIRAHLLRAARLDLQRSVGSAVVPNRRHNPVAVTISASPTRQHAATLATSGSILRRYHRCRNGAPDSFAGGAHVYPRP